MTTIRTRLLTATALILATTAPAFAQSVEAGTTDPGEIVVTGTRLASAADDAPAPVQSITARQIDATGDINLQDVLQRSPLLGAPGFSRTNSNFDLRNAGTATINLRNLGADRTLVLIDGRRVAPGIVGRSVVNLNTIPTQFIDRVDVMTGGVSAVYGADAVAGVVNIVLKRNLEGLTVEAQSGISPRGDGAEHQVDIAGGTSFADGRGSIMAHVGYSRQEAVMLGARSTEEGSMAIDATSLGYSNGNDADLFKPLISQSGFTNQGTYFSGPSTYTYDGGNLVEGRGKFNRADYRYLAIPTTRRQADLRGSFEISRAAEVYIDASYADTRVRTKTEAFPFGTSYLTDSGQIPVESLVNGILTRHAFVPDAIFDDAIDEDGDGLRDIYVSKRLGDLGPRMLSDRRRSYRIVAGLRGDIGGGWSYDGYFIHGETRQKQTGTGLFNSANLLNALSAVVDAQDLDSDGNRTEVVCTGATARAAGCIPANIFGPNSLAPAAAYIGAPQRLDASVRQQVAHFDVRGELGALTAGARPIAVALGVEYQNNRARADYDALTEAGLNGGNMIPDLDGRYDVKEAFGEVSVPLLADRPFINELTVRGAARVSDYSTAGTAFSYNYGAEWSPTPGLRLRISRAQSMRAPNIGELFSPAIQNFPGGLKDPCVGVTATSTGGLADRCRSDAGVAANIAANGAFVQTPADQQAITSYTGGSRDLKVEKGKSFSAGVVVAPEGGMLRGLTLSADYFDIKVEDAIVNASLQYELNRCYADGADDACSRIVRRGAAQGLTSAGSIDEVNGSYANSGGLRTSGIDVALGYRKDLADAGLAGELALGVAYTHLLKGYSVPVPGGERDYFAGEIGAAKDRFTANLDYRLGAVRMSFIGTYVGESFLDDQFSGYRAGQAPEGQPENLYRIAPEFYADLQVGVSFDGGEFYVGAKNLLDNKPPFLADISAGASDAGVLTDPGVYDTLGRRFYAGVRVRF